MNKSIVRLTELELVNFRNVKNGKIVISDMKTDEPFDCKADIVGIYGQNGSGKTSVIDSIYFLKKLLTGEALPKDTENYIYKGMESAGCRFRFYIENNENRSIAEYSFSFEKKNGTIVIANEKLRIIEINGSKKIKRTIIEYSFDNEDIISPKSKRKAIVEAEKDNDVNLKVAKIFAVKDRKSMLFGEHCRTIITSGLKDEPQLSNAITALCSYAENDLFVLKNNRNGSISLDYGMPLSFAYKKDDKMILGDIFVSLVEPTVVDCEQFDIVTQIISGMNGVLNAMVPGLMLSIKNYGTQMTEKGKDGVRFELLSEKNDMAIPLRYESEGILKIISILNIVINMYNNPSVTVVIDELDASVFECLLGDLLHVIEESGKGQLIFTSHNLRPLEVIDKSSLIFTTTNEKRRYIHLTNVKGNNNLRNVYIRSLFLGGQKENIYNSTKEFEIRRALRKAGGDVRGTN